MRTSACWALSQSTMRWRYCCRRGSCAGSPMCSVSDLSNGLYAENGRSAGATGGRGDRCRRHGHGGRCAERRGERILENFSLHATALVLLALLIANAGTVISEFVGLAASLQLVYPGLQYVGVPLISLGLWLMVVRGSYSSVEKIFLAMTLVF